LKRCSERKRSGRAEALRKPLTRWWICWRVANQRSPLRQPKSSRWARIQPKVPPWLRFCRLQSNRKPRLRNQFPTRRWRRNRKRRRQDVCRCESDLAGAGGRCPTGMPDGSGRPGGGKVSRAGVEAPAHAGAAKTQAYRGDGYGPEEGKSLVAANLALNQSRSKVLKTLLVDGDLRRPTVASRFGCESSLPGLSECLRGERQLSEVVYKLNGSGLWFLPAGLAPENPLELMQGDAFRSCSTGWESSSTGS